MVTENPVRIGVFGASGRTGSEIIRTLCERRGGALSEGVLTSAVVSAQSPFCGEDCGKKIGVVTGVIANANLEQAIQNTDVMIDFTLPAPAIEHVRACVKQKKPIVIGTTGFISAELDEIRRAAEEIPVLLSGNMSLGVNILAGAVQRISAILGKEWDAEIIEAHHHRKKDAPSGTAKMLIQAVSNDIRSQTVHHTTTKEARKTGKIGVSVIRGGGVIGEHEVRFIAEHEELNFSHRAFDRSLFAEGAVFAAMQLVRMKPGFYDMQNVLNIG
jgi:4-hydroxy-tetrahydrodipicolinate reductase